MVAPPTEPDLFAPITTVPSSLSQSSSNGGDGLDALRLSNVLHQIDLPTWSAPVSEPKRASPKVGVTMSGSGPVDTNATNAEAVEKLTEQTPATSVIDPPRNTESTLDSMEAGLGTIRAENGDAIDSPVATKSSQESLLTHHDPQSVEVLETGGDVPDAQDFPVEGMALPGLDVSVENVVPVPPEDGKMTTVAILADTTSAEKASSTATEPMPEDPLVEESKPGTEASLLVLAPPESEELVPKGSVDMPLQADSPVDPAGTETNGSREEHFSDNTKLVTLKGSINQKIDQMISSDWEMSTNLHGAFNQILSTAVKNKVSQAEMPETLMIFSDMQFNACVKYDDSAMEMIARKYSEAGYELPKVVFWNLNASGNSPVEFDKSGTALVSGFSPAIAASVLGADPDAFSPEAIMLKAVMNSRYDLM
jgi:hypothetical protein